MRIGTLIYIVIGIVVAFSNGYQNLVSLGRVLAFALAVVLWPLIFFGVNFNSLVGV